ncbi:MAG: amidohydrolase family protein [bacterium]
MNKEHRYIIGNGILTDGLDVFFASGAVLIEKDRIAKIGATEDIFETGIEFIDVSGRLILPGLMNAHHHFYSAFSTGVTPLEQPANFLGILEHLWWPWDAALEKETVYYSALLTGMDCLRNGVTTVFDHHASMNFVEGSLDTISKACEQLGIRATLCFETSDRMGLEAVDKHIEENVTFYNNHINDDRIKGCFGLHANLTLSDETLAKVSDAKPYLMPIHSHCGEDIADLEFCQNLGFSGPVHRLDAFGLLKNNSILAHCIYLSDKDIEILNERDIIVASNSESNANNRVGKMKLGLFPYILGTDGMTSDILAAMRSHYLLNSIDKIDFEDLRNVFFSHRYSSQQKFFPYTGSLSPGSFADIAVLDYNSVTPFNNRNTIGHLVFGVKTSRAFMTVVNGEILYIDGAFTRIDQDNVMQTARKVAQRQIRRYYG